MDTSKGALPIALGYHRAWTSGQFPAAIHLLALDLCVEVPINAYPTTESFANALVGFGSMVTGTTLLSTLGDDAEATLIYDMDVTGIGALRIAEHFTVLDGRITRIRQIHDTWALRSAGFGASA